MNFIKAATVYKCELPGQSDLDSLLSEHQFVPLDKTQFCKAGFVASHDGSFVEQLPNILAFTLRYDEKIIPKSLENSEQDKKVADFESSEGRHPNKKEKQAIKEEVFGELVSLALPRERLVTCFYNQKERFLIVPTASRKLSSIVITKLLKAVGSISTTTLHIDDIKQSLTGKLKAYLQGDDNALHPFTVGGACKLKVSIKGEKDKSISFNVGDLQESTDGIMEAIASSAKVTELGLSNVAMSFRLSEDFIFKGVYFPENPDEDDYENDAERFRIEAPAQVLMLSGAINELLNLFEYKETADE